MAHLPVYYLVLATHEFILRRPSCSLSRELTEPTADRPADARKMKSAGRRGNIGPSVGLVFLELTEPADRTAVVRPMLRFFEHIQPAASQPIS